MKKYGLVVLAVVLLLGEVTYFTIRNSKPQDNYPLKVRVNVPGAVMVLQNIRFEPESGNILRVRGTYFNGVPPNNYDVIATISDSQTGPPTPGSQYHYTLLPEKEGVPGSHFFLDFQSPPMTAPTVFCHVSLIDKGTQAVGAEFLFKTANPARAFAVKQ